MIAVGFVAGALFAIGLAVAGATEPGVVLDGFRFDADWDPRLWLMFAGAHLVAIPTTRWLARRRRTLRGEPLSVLPARPVDARLVIGALVFGVGWGLGGICPGPAFTTAASGSVHAALAFAGLCVGIVLHDAFTRGA